MAVSLLNSYRFATLPPGAGVGAHTYWRLLISTNNGDGSFVSVGHIDMYAGFARDNLCVGGTPMASSGGVFGNVTANSFNNAIETGQWAVNKTGADWIGYLFPTAVAVNGLMLRTYSNQNALMLKNFAVQSSDDGTTWTTQWSVTNATYAAMGDYFPLVFWNSGYASTYTGSPVTARRYWRLYGLTRAGPSSYACAEMAMRLTPGGAQQCSGGTAIAKGSAGGAAANALDGNAATYWANNAGGGDTVPSWLGYDFGSGNDKKIAEFMWQARNDSGPAAQQSPTRGVVQSSSDNTNWSSIFEAYDATTWTVGMQKSFTDNLYI